MCDLVKNTQEPLMTDDEVIIEFEEMLESVGITSDFVGYYATKAVFDEKGYVVSKAECVREYASVIMKREVAHLFMLALQLEELCDLGLLRPVIARMLKGDHSQFGADEWIALCAVLRYGVRPALRFGRYDKLKLYGVGDFDAKKFDPDKQFRLIKGPDDPLLKRTRVFADDIYCSLLSMVVERVIRKREAKEPPYKVRSAYEKILRKNGITFKEITRFVHELQGQYHKLKPLTNESIISNIIRNMEKYDLFEAAQFVEKYCDEALRLESKEFRWIISIVYMSLHNYGFISVTNLGDYLQMVQKDGMISKRDLQLGILVLSNAGKCASDYYAETGYRDKK